MTAKTQTETGARKSKMLKLNKQTLRDLTSRNDKADAVRGGVPQPSKGPAECTATSGRPGCPGA